MELREKTSDLQYFNEKCDLYEKENASLKNNKLNSIEINDKVKELQNENFILHEKNLELLNKLEKVSQENLNYEKKMRKQEEKIESDKNMETMLKTGNFANNNNSNTITNKIGGGVSNEQIENKERDKVKFTSTLSAPHHEVDKADQGLRLYNMMYVDKVKFHF